MGRERKDKQSLKAIPGEILERAKALLDENPKRSVRRVIEFLESEFPQSTGKVKRSTLSRALKNAGWSRNHPTPAISFEASSPNDLWQGDIMYGPRVSDNDGEIYKSFLFCFLDDTTRDIPHGEFYSDEKLPRLEDCFEKALLKRGIPKRIFVDNGLVYSSKQFGFICGCLGIHKIHSTPYHPISRGKIERFFRTVRESFLSEIERVSPMPLRDLNRYFFTWLETDYRKRKHSTTKKNPADHFDKEVKEISFPDPAKLRLLFLLREERLVGKTGLVKLFGNRYWVDPSLIGKKVEVGYDPFDLRKVWILLDGEVVSEGSPQSLITLRKAKVPEEVMQKPCESAARFLKILEKKAQKEGLRFYPLKRRENDNDSRA